MDSEAPTKAKEDAHIAAGAAANSDPEDEATKGPAAAAAAAAAAAGKARPFHASFEGQHVAYLLHNGRTWYTGETANLTRRYKEHTRGTIRGSYTKGKGPWRLVAVAAPFSNRSVAQGFETTLKGKSGGQAKRLEAMRKLATEYSAPGAPIAVHVNPDLSDSESEGSPARGRP
eukprot:tig00000411_g509.t1